MSDTELKMKEGDVAPQQTPPLPLGTVTIGGFEIDFIEYLYKLLFNLKWILLAALLGAAIAAYYTVNYITPLYRATSMIYFGESNTVINLSGTSLDTVLSSDYITAMNTWEVHERVIESLDLPYSYSYMKSIVSVTNTDNTKMLNISVTSADPQEAAMIANEYARVGSEYIAETMNKEKPSIMSVALVPNSPISPNLKTNVLKGFIVGAVIICAVVFVMVLLDDKVHSSDDIRKYADLPTLTIMPLEGVKNKGTKNYSREYGNYEYRDHEDNRKTSNKTKHGRKKREQDEEEEDA